MTEIIIITGDIFELEDTHELYTAYWKVSELYFIKNNSNNNTNFISTIQHNSCQLLRINNNNNTITLLWNNNYYQGYMPNENILKIIINNNEIKEFKRITKMKERFTAIIHDNDEFNYIPWGGLCTAKWIGDDLIIAKDLNQTSGNFVWKTMNGDGRRLLNQGTIEILWDNKELLVAFMPDPNTITVWHGEVTYDFTRVIPVVPVAKPIEYEFFEENTKKLSTTPEVSLTFASSTCETTPVPPYLTLEMAKLICSIAQLRAVELGVVIVVSIYDNHGNLKLYERMDNTTFGSIRMSQLKGLTSASFPVSTKALAEKSSKLPGNPFSSVPDMILIPGGLPIILRNTHIGSIGVSGARPDIDEQCAQAGINGLYNHFNNPTI